MSSLDIAALGQLTANQTISPAQFAWLLTAPASDTQLILSALDSLKTLQSGQPQLFAQARDALFVAKGGPSSGSLNSSTLASSSSPPSPPSSSPVTSPITSQALAEDHFSLAAEDSKQEETREVAEVVAICIDVSGSMSTKFEKDGQVDASAINQNAKSIGRTRLEAVKQMFYGFRDQTCAFEYGTRHRLGLISYDDNVKELIKPTDKMDEFEAVIDQLKTGGSTAMYEAIHKGCKMLAPLRAKYPNADMRVLCLSDGENNSHNITAEQALKALQDVEACVDFLLVGNTPDSKVLQLVQATEGECYQITTLSEGFDCLESKGVISLAARRNGAPKPPYQRKEVNLQELKAAPLIRAGQPQVSQSAASSLKVLDAASLASVISSSSSSSSTNTPKPNARQKRVLSELVKFESAGLGHMFKLFPGSSKGDDMIDFIKVLLVGPAKTSYEGGVFELLVEFPADYPFKPPRISFVTPIYHYAVSAEGKICSSILMDSWSPAYSFFSALQTVHRDLFEDTDPTCERSLRSWLSELKRVNPTEYEQNAKQLTAQEAKETVEEASARILAGLPKPPSAAAVAASSSSTSSGSGSVGGGMSSSSAGTNYKDVSSLKVENLQTMLKSTSPPSVSGKKRLLSELKKFDEAKLEHRFRVFPGGQDNLEYFKVLMKGKEGTPYEGGVFELFFSFPSEYPFKPPSVKFVTPFYHYAVSEQGQICSPTLRDSWSPAVSLLALLSQLYGDLMDCDSVDSSCDRALRSDLVSLKQSNRAGYDQHARQCTQQHARKDFEDLSIASSPSTSQVSTA